MVQENLKSDENFCFWKMKVVLLILLLLSVDKCDGHDKTIKSGVHVERYIVYIYNKIDLEEKRQF